MKVIFLDIDGVLNWADTKDRINGFVGLDPAHIARFNKIIEAHPDAKIVISSTWRRTSMMGVYTDFDGLKKLLADRGLKGEIIDHTPIHFGRRGRGNEIREWIEDHHKGATFVVLDDSLEDMEGYVVGGNYDFPEIALDDLRPYHVVTHWSGDPNVSGEEGGLQEKHVSRAIHVLGGGRLCTVDYPFCNEPTDNPRHTNCLKCNGGFP